MPRQRRLILPNMPHHIVQRGHNRDAVFRNTVDYRFYLSNVVECKRLLNLKVYSYCLMSNHVHLLVGTGEDCSAVSELMKRVAARQTRMVNRTDGRTGSLWDGRYHISAVDSESYLLQCMRYIELNPVKAGMVSRPGDYPYSSFRARVGRVTSRWLDQDPCYEAMGNSPAERQSNYRAFVEDYSAAEAHHEFLRAAVERNQLTGDRGFVEEVENRAGCKVSTRGPGRPKKGTDLFSEA